MTIDTEGFDHLKASAKTALKVVCLEEGYRSLFDLVEEYHTDSKVPTYCPICMACGDDAEPDQTQGYCSGCGKSESVSILILAGII